MRLLIIFIAFIILSALIYMVVTDTKCKESLHLNDTQERVKAVLHKRFSNIKEYDDKHNLYGVSIGPKGVRTAHRNYEIGSKEHVDDLAEMHYILDEIHRFVLKHDILYTLSFGNLLGYYRENGQIFWDDDIDILLSNNHFNKFIHLLEHSTDDKWEVFQNKKFTQINKKIIMNGKEFNFEKCELDGETFYKIRSSNCRFSSGEYCTGGLDIFNVNHMREYKEGKEDFYNKILSDKNNLEIIQYNTVPTFSIKQKYALKNLEDNYGKNWSIKKHPSLH